MGELGACPIRARSEGDRGSITVTRRHALPAATSTGAGQEAGRTIFASRCSKTQTANCAVYLLHHCVFRRVVHHHEAPS